MIADTLGWIGNIFFLASPLFIARKKVSGLYLNCIGNCFYVGYGVLLQSSSILVLSLFLIILNGYGITRWTRFDGREGQRFTCGHCGKELSRKELKRYRNRKNKINILLCPEHYAWYKEMYRYSEIEV